MVTVIERPQEGHPVEGEACAGVLGPRPPWAASSEELCVKDAADTSYSAPVCYSQPRTDRRTAGGWPAGEGALLYSRCARRRLGLTGSVGRRGARPRGRSAPARGASGVSFPRMLGAGAPRSLTVKLQRISHNPDSWAVRVPHA